jgi:putative tryptophan/tyrosine transport system substrate-binding protein
MMKGKKSVYFKTGAATVLFLLSAALLLSLGCTSKPKVFRVGVLSGLDCFYAITDGFKEKMTDLGYIEGKKILYDIQKSNFDMAAYERILKKFMADKVDLILVFATEAAQLAKAITGGTGIPVVFANVLTEGTGLVDSVQEPGGNMTGVRWQSQDVAKNFELMHELAPRVKRIWVMYQRGCPIVPCQINALRAVSKVTGVSLMEVAAGDVKELERELLKGSGLIKKGEDAIITIAEPLVVSPEGMAVTLTFAAEHNLPMGGILITGGPYETTYGMAPQSFPQGKQAAVIADKILKGTPPGKIPVVSAEYYFQFNYRAAHKLGLQVSEGFLSRADTVIR